LLLLLLIFLPAFGIIVASGLKQRHKEIAKAQNNAVLSVQSLAAQQEQVILSTKVLLSVLAQSPAIQRLNVEASNQLLQKIEQHFPLYSTILATATPDGNLFAASKAFVHGHVNLSDRKHIKDAIRTQRFSVGEYMKGRVSSFQSLNYTLPALDANGRLVAIVIAGFRLDEYSRFMVKANVPAGYSVTVTDWKGVRLFCRPPISEATPGEAIGANSPALTSSVDHGIFEAKSPDGKERIYAFRQLRLKEEAQPYMYMLVGAPKAEILHQANVQMLTNLFILSLTAALAMSLVWGLGDLVLVRPINRLVAATQHLGKGEMTIRTGLRHSSDELGQLAKSFDDMASLLELRSVETKNAELALSKANAELEERVQQRTAELSEANATLHQMLIELQNSRARLENQASTDELTGLPNRRLLADRLTQALAGAERQQSMLALLYLDLDGFKFVNDTLGHSMGDLLLQQVAERLRRRIRASDTLARIGGDEFTIVMSHIRDAEEAELVAREVLAQLGIPFELNGHELTLTASMGISLYPGDALDPEQLIQHADTAMYVAKSSGKNRYKVFNTEFGDIVRERLELENQLRGAAERGELAVHYQPEFDLATRRLLRFEALARWRHPTLGMIPPNKFIPIAEETGLICPIGLWVMEQACTEAMRWQAIADGPIQVAVNVSTVQFIRDDFVDSVASVLKRTGLNPKLMQLEVTESVLMRGIGDAGEKMSHLRSLGVSMAVDDFGTGYSTLSYLPRLPFDCLKIDRSFLSQTSASRDARALMHSLVSLAHDLKMKVIVEGVETPEQLEFTQQIGCDQIQGYLFGRPTANPDQYLLKEHDRLLQMTELNSRYSSTLEI
jgi:diguanylate cyclase (GGDEF)-like protein